MDLRLKIDGAFIEKLQVDMSIDKAEDVLREALTILGWAVRVRQRGRLVLSATSDGKNPERLAMPSLDAVQKLGAGR